MITSIKSKRIKRYQFKNTKPNHNQPKVKLQIIQKNSSTYNRDARKNPPQRRKNPPKMKKKMRDRERERERERERNNILCVGKLCIE